jgi:hypothetical protein
MNGRSPAQYVRFQLFSMRLYGANGAILSQGGRVGGWSVYMKDGKPAYVYNFLGLVRYTVAAPEALPSGAQRSFSTSPMTASARAAR